MFLLHSLASLIQSLHQGVKVCHLNRAFAATEEDTEQTLVGRLNICDYIRRVAGIWVTSLRNLWMTPREDTGGFPVSSKDLPKKRRLQNPVRLWWERQVFTRRYENSCRPFLGFWLNKTRLELGQDHRARRGQIKKKLKCPEWWPLAPAVRG